MRPAEQQVPFSAVRFLALNATPRRACTQAVLMEDCRNQGCDEELIGDGACGGELQAIVYFLSFIVVVSMVLLQLVPAFVIQNFEEFDSKDRWLVKVEDLESFRSLWAEVSTGELSPSTSAGVSGFTSNALVSTLPRELETTIAVLSITTKIHTHMSGGLVGRATA